MGLNSAGYKGGSPRVSNNHNKIVIQTKKYDNNDSQKIVDVLSNQYLKYSVKKEELNNFLIFLNNSIKSEIYNREYNYSSPLIPKFINSLEQLKGDNKIDNNYLNNIVSGIQNILLEITPKKEENPPTPKLTEDADGIKLPTSYSNNSNNVRFPKTKTIITKNIKAKEILKITESFKGYYNNNIITKEELILLSTYFQDLKNDIKSEKELLNKFISKNFDFIKNSYIDKRLSSSQLLFIIQEIGIILKTKQPVITKEKHIPKDKIKTITPGYIK